MKLFFETETKQKLGVIDLCKMFSYLLKSNVSQIFNVIHKKGILQNTVSHQKISAIFYTDLKYLNPV